MTEGKAVADRKTEFWWASIAGADPEPVEKTQINGRPCVYTCGCADPFYLDDRDNPVRLGAVRNVPGMDELRLDFRSKEPIERPSLADKAEAAEISRYYHPRRMPRHGWRGPR